MATGILGYDLKPEVHRPICDFLQPKEPLNKVILHFRGSRKTTVCTKSYIPWEIINDRNVRILLGNEKSENSEDILTEIQGHFERNALFRWLFPEVIPENTRKTTWSSKEMLVPRDEHWSEPTVSTIGVTGTKVSQHYDILHFDDLIGLAALESPTVMKRAIRFLNYSRGLKTNAYKTRTNLIGTRWDLRDVYEHAVKKLNFAEFRRGPLVYDENGKVQSVYPEVISTEDLIEIMTSDPFQWATNFANNPYDTANKNFDPLWIAGQHCWTAPDGWIRYSTPSGLLSIQDPGKLRVYLHVDPSLGEKDDSDQTAFVLVGLNDEGTIFILDAWKKRIDPVVTLDNIFEYQESHVPFLTTVEGVAYQKSLKFFADDRARRERKYLNVEAVLPGTRQDKITRIKFRLQPYFRDRRIYYMQHLFQFVEEYNIFGRAHPDILDALAQGPEVWKFPSDGKFVKSRTARINKILSGNRGVTGYGS